MKINKITHGHVIQTWDTQLNRWLGQEFVAGNEAEYEEAGSNRVVNPIEVWSDTPEPYLPFLMEPTDTQKPQGAKTMRKRNVKNNPQQRHIQ